MAVKTAIQLTGTGNTYELLIQVKRPGGIITQGIAIGDVTYQNQAMLLMAQKGELKEYPTVGVGLSDIVNDENLTGWKAEIIAQFEDDGQRIDKLILNEKGLTLGAKYK
jgi:hypothetical protein